MNRIFTLFTTVIFLFPCYSFCQTVNPSVTNIAGGAASSGYYRFAWSAGEMCIIETYSQPSIQLTNGFLQPGMEHTGPTPAINFFATGDIIIFPNPAATIAEINFKVSQAGQVTLRLTDVQGKLLHTRQFDYNGIGHTEKLNVQPYAAGAYFLTIQLTPNDQSATRKGVFKLVHVAQ